MSDSIIPILFGVTFLAVLIYAAVSWLKARKAQDEGEKSAMPPPDAESAAKVHTPR